MIYVQIDMILRISVKSIITSIKGLFVFKLDSPLTKNYYKSHKLKIFM